MANLLLDTNNLIDFIKSLKINPEQEKVLIDKLPSLNEKERLDLLEMLKDVYVLNEEENQAKEKIKESYK